MKLLPLFVILLSAGIYYFYSQYIDDRLDYQETLLFQGKNVTFSRQAHGVMQVVGDDDFAVTFGLGYSHAKDRLVSMVLVRMAGLGMLTQTLKSDPKLFEVDVKYRKLNLQNVASKVIELATPHQMKLLEAYVQGVNTYIQKTWMLPFELYLIGYNRKSALWEPRDCVIIGLVLSYEGLADGQSSIEHFVFDSIRRGANADLLKKIFHPNLEGLDDIMIDLLKKIKNFSFFPQKVSSTGFLPRGDGSNNWVINGALSESGFPISACDPHLEGNRLPPVWYEMVTKTTNEKSHPNINYTIGITFPGIPYFFMGRNNLLSWSITYGFMDQIDHFIMEVKDKKYRYGDEWRSFNVRNETIYPKKEKPIQLTFYETHRGILETNFSDSTLEDGYYFLFAFAPLIPRNTIFSSILDLPLCETVECAQKVVAGLPSSTNFLFADRQGNIGYQQTGSLPKRKADIGLLPIIGWDPSWDWDGLVSSDQLLSIYNPPEGFLATANNYFQRLGAPQAISAHMGNARLSRIQHLIRKYSEKAKLNVRTMEHIQCDLHANDGERYMEIIRPLLGKVPETPKLVALSQWNLQYDIHSWGASIFTDFHRALFAEIYGDVFGIENWNWVTRNDPVIVDFQAYFNEIILQNESLLFQKESRDDIFIRVLRNVTANDGKALKRYGEYRGGMLMKNLLFGNQLPSFFGFDKEIIIPGAHDTIWHGMYEKFDDGEATFVPSYRLITDLVNDECETSIIGGVSGRRFSSLYTKGIDEWLQCSYKTLKP